MKTIQRVSALGAVCGLLLPGADWPTQSGGPQRDAWARAEKTITKDNVGSLELLYKYQSDNQARGRNSLSTPIISGMLITYRGFKEMLLFSGSGDNVYSVDADLNRLLWKRHFDLKHSTSGSAASVCPGGLTTSVAMAGSSSAAFRGAGPPPKAKPDAKPKAKPTVSDKNGPSLQDKLSSDFGHLGGVFTVSSDGYLHTLNTSTGEDLRSPIKFLPPQSNVTSLNVVKTVVYAATTNRCGGKANALYAVDVTEDNGTVSRFELNSGEVLGMAGTAIGTDGTVFMGVTHAKSDKTDYGDALLALNPDLTVKDYFEFSGAAPTGHSGEQGGITPVVVSWKDKELVVAGGTDGRVYLLDATSLGGVTHKKPLAEIGPVAAPGGLRGAFSSWFDADSETRWIYAPVWGAVPSGVAATANGDAKNGSIVAMQLAEMNGVPALKPVWTSRDLLAPAPVATAGGMVFALATGNANTPAVLYALDAATGKELYSTGKMAGTFSHPGGVAVANGRVYFTAHDNAVYCLGFSKLNPQLTDR